jgi:hypothetical protein
MPPVDCGTSVVNDVIKTTELCWAGASGDGGAIELGGAEKEGGATDVLAGGTKDELGSSCEVAKSDENKGSRSLMSIRNKSHQHCTHQSNWTPFQRII